MDLERLVSIFDRKTENIIKEINIDKIDINILKMIFVSNEDDPNLYNPYQIDILKLIELNKYFERKIEYDDKFIYQLDCFKISKSR